MTESQQKLELCVNECFRRSLISVCDDTTIVARAPAYTRACARARHTRVLRARCQNFKKIAHTH